MKKNIILILFLFVVCTLNCQTIKIGLFRGTMKLVGGKVYKSRFIALNDPKFISADEVNYLKDEEEVIGIANNGIAKAYPLTMSFHHHIFNDEIGGKRILVTFCPLTHTAMIFNPVLENRRTLNFTVDGLKESNMIMIDDSTQSFWVQATGKVIKGRFNGAKLDLLFGLHTTWRIWRQLHPNTFVLSRDTGFKYDYSRFPFQEKYFKYKKNKRFLFNVSYKDERFHPKEIVLGTIIGNSYKAYPFCNLSEKGVINDTLACLPIAVIFDKNSQTITAFSRQFNGKVLEFRSEVDSTGMIIKDSIFNSSWNFEGMAYDGHCKDQSLIPITSFKAFWFAWITFYPETLIYYSQTQ